MRLFELKRDDDAVSPVIGVILMVAITVILAAVIGTFVLGLGSDVKANPQAGVSFDEAANSTSVTLTSAPRIDDGSNVTVSYANSSVCGNLTSVGSTVSCGNSQKLVVTATYQGQDAVVATYNASS